MSSRALRRKLQHFTLAARDLVDELQKSGLVVNASDQPPPPVERVRISNVLASAVLEITHGMMVLTAILDPGLMSAAELANADAAMRTAAGAVGSTSARTDVKQPDSSAAPEVRETTANGCTDGSTSVGTHGSTAVHPDVLP